MQTRESCVHFIKPQQLSIGGATGEHGGMIIPPPNLSENMVMYIREKFWVGVGHYKVSFLRHVSSCRLQIVHKIDLTFLIFLKI